ncbi:MAG: prolipoprotein diacylglyceryl transferase [Eubacterium sp.]|jgi:phosphatidylglycerol:prolipoprotein diacylglycerol transferase|nr:prolipoprotein diacylglyceryl transferase [Eubacterium sp.]
MFPYFYLFGRMVGLYGLLSIAGILAAGFYSCRVAKKSNLDDNNIITILLWAAAGAFIGAHLLYAITNLGLLAELFGKIGRGTSFNGILNDLYKIFGGMVFFGGLIGGVTAGVTCIKRRKLDFNAYLDCIVPGIPLFHAFGRVGCFMGGCCYGIRYEHGIIFRNALIPEANGIPRLPVQLIEAGFNAALFAVLAALLKKNGPKGKLLYIYLIAYAIERFVIEFFRADELRGSIAGLSTSQIISLLIIFTVVCVLAKKAINKNPA